MTIEQAREKARVVIKRIKSGEPPPRAPESVSAVAQDWLNRHVDGSRLRTANDLRRHVRVYIEPDSISARDFATLRRSDVVAFLDRIEDARGPAVADLVLSTLRSIAGWYEKRSDDYRAPFTRDMRRRPKAQRQRQRILDDHELSVVWRACESAGNLGDIIRLLLLTCQRRAKIFGMRWQDVDEQGVWSIPTEPGEKPNANRIQLSPAALAIIRARPRFASNAYIFPQKPNSTTVTNFQKRCGVDFHLHDLRRSSRSYMARIGIPFEVAESVLGHTLPGVAPVYNVHRYDQEKAQALERLAALIQQVVYPTDNVVTLRGAAS
jgi:integrase